jgi:hypothetical protein
MSDDEEGVVRDIVTTPRAMKDYGLKLFVSFVNTNWRMESPYATFLVRTSSRERTRHTDEFTDNSTLEFSIVHYDLYEKLGSFADKQTSPTLECSVVHYDLHEQFNF